MGTHINSDCEEETFCLEEVIFELTLRNFKTEKIRVGYNVSTESGTY